MLKTCSKCGVELRLEEFAADRSKASGRKSICKGCDRERARRYYERNRERVLEAAFARNEAARDAKEAAGWGGRRNRWSAAAPATEPTEDAA